MASSNPGQPSQSPSQNPSQEAAKLESHLKRIAQQWHQRLADPLIQAQVKSGQIQISPLVRRLLEAYPPESSK